MIATLTRQKPLSSARMRRLAVGAIALVAALAVTMPAHARGVTGRYTPGLVNCSGLITVGPPAMYATADLLRDSSGRIIAFEPGQWVSYRATLAKLIGSRWVPIAWGPEHARIQYSMHHVNPQAWWRNLRTNQEGNGMTSFQYQGPGRYKVFVDYHWYPIRLGLPDGHLVEWAPWYSDDATWFFNPLSTDGACRMG
jgi:hypothetical protein